MTSPILSVIIPAYNEEKRVGNTLEAIASHVKERRPEWAEGRQLEVIVVDDGSSDDTRGAAGAWVDRLPGLQVRPNPRNMGKGASIRNGMLAAKGRWRLFADADNSTPFEQVEDLLRAAERQGAGVAFGSRACPGAKLEKRQPITRELMGRGFNLLVQAILLPRVKDTQCGFKMFSAEAAEAIFPRMTRSGFSFDVEALYLARKLGFHIAEVPIRWIDDRHSRVSPIKDSAKMFLDLIRVRMIHSDASPEEPGYSDSGERESPDEPPVRREAKK